MPIEYFAFLGRVLKNRERLHGEKSRENSSEELHGWTDTELMKQLMNTKIKETDQGPRSDLGDLRCARSDWG